MKRRHEYIFTFFSAGAILRVVYGLAALLVRKPRLFAQLALAALRSRRDFVRLLRLPVDADSISTSPLFDREWYLQQHPELRRSGLSPELHFLLDDSASGHWASPRFSCDEYLKLNPEVIESGLNALVHYEQYGRFIGCPASYADAAQSAPKFPDSAQELECAFDAAPALHLRTAVYATFSPNGKIAERDLFYLRGLKEVCDNIIYVSNSPVFPEETAKLRGLVSAAIFQNHGGYDFGSYRIGLQIARKHGWLAADRCNELVFANSSCYAPVRPFAGMFCAMQKRSRADFWGLTFNTQRSGSPHLQSFILVFRRPVLDSSALEDFFDERPVRATRAEAISLYEIQLTDYLRKAGFVPDAFVRPRLPYLHEFNPTTRPITLMRRYKSPLVKVKALRGESSQPPKRVLSVVRRLNPELGSTIDAELSPKKAASSGPTSQYPDISRKNDT